LSKKIVDTQNICVTSIDNDHVYIVFRFQAIALEMQRKNIQHHIRVPCHFNLYRLGS